MCTLKTDIACDLYTDHLPPTPHPITQTLLHILQHQETQPLMRHFLLISMLRRAYRLDISADKQEAPKLVFQINTVACFVFLHCKLAGSFYTVAQQFSRFLHL